MEWNYLPKVSSIYDDYIKEIEQLFFFLRLLQDKNTYYEFNKNLFIKNSNRLNSRFSNKKTIRVRGLANITYKNNYSYNPVLLNSSICLMLYNFIESICTNMMLDIYRSFITYSETKQACCFGSWSDKVLELILKYLYDDKNKKLIKKVLIGDYSIKEILEDLLSMYYTNDDFSAQNNRTKGNKNGKKMIWFKNTINLKLISEVVLKGHGIKFDNYSKFMKKKDDAISHVRDNRNKLAHGVKTFREYGDSVSLDELYKIYLVSKGFIQGLMNVVNENLEKEYYKVNNNVNLKKSRNMINKRFADNPA